MSESGSSGKDAGEPDAVERDVVVLGGTAYRLEDGRRAADVLEEIKNRSDSDGPMELKVSFRHRDLGNAVVFGTVLVDPKNPCCPLTLGTMRVYGHPWP